MNNNQYINLDRRFFEIPHNEDGLTDYERYFAGSMGGAISWADIEQEYRVIILAEAGAGKTVEIRQAARRLRMSGKRAFYMRLEYVVDGIESAFDLPEMGSFEEFEDWKASNDEAWIFLDSVDEARLSNPRDFEKAIRKLSTNLSNSDQRAHIFITSRTSEWRPVSDLILVKTQLSYKTAAQQHRPENTVESQTEDHPAVTASSSHAVRTTIDEANVEPIKILSLTSLDEEQVRLFANAFKINDPDRFFDEIRRRDVDDFLSRPQDVKDLIDFWDEKSRIGSRLEIIRNSIDKKLREIDRTRDELRPLTHQKALAGATKLAAAVTFQKKPRILVPENVAESQGVDATSVLADWSPADVAALLSRPLFDDAIYGTVRFHHRSVREFLTADWIFQLLEDGKPRREIERLFFRNQYGVEVTVPTTRPILPWLALRDQKIRDKLLEVAPNILFEGGDPTQLPKETRHQVLNNLCRNHSADRSSDVSFNYEAIQRFATPDMGNEIRKLIEKYRNDRDLCLLLLGLVWHGKLTSCADLAHEIATSDSQDKYSLIAAVRAVSATCSKQLKVSVVNYVINNVEHIHRSVLSEMVSCYAPIDLGVNELLQILSKTPKPERYSYSGLDGSLIKLIPRCSTQFLFDLVKGIRTLLAIPPFIDQRSFEMSERYVWLLKIVSRACERLVEEQHPSALSEDCLSIVSLISLACHYYDFSTDDQRFGELVPMWTELNRRLFWHDVTETRRVRFLEKGERLTDWWDVRVRRNYWRFDEDDFEWAAAEILSRETQDDKLVALTLAFRIYADNGRPQSWRRRLKTSVTENIELSDRLNELLKPPRISSQQKKWKQQDRDHKRRMTERDRRQKEYHENWKVRLSKNTDVLRDVAVAAKAEIWDAQEYLYKRMQKHNPERNRWANGNWRDLSAEYGKPVSEAFRDGAVEYWRAYTPKLMSEGIDDPNSVPYPVVLGLCGLEIEATETDNWPSQLGSEEARLACRYAFNEMNGFPDWLLTLYETFPGDVNDSILQEVLWEIRDCDDESEPHYILSDLLWHGEWINTVLARKILYILVDSIPKHVGTLEKCLGVVLRDEAIANDEISRVATSQVHRDVPLSQKAMWCAVLVSVSPDDGMSVLEQILSELDKPVATTQFCELFSVSLLGSRREKTYARAEYKTPNTLKQLYVILHQHIKIEDDLNRAGTGVFSPTTRDYAQEARNSIISILTEIPGKEAYLALNEVSQKHPSSTHQSWLKSEAIKRATLDADIEALGA